MDYELIRTDRRSLGVQIKDSKVIVRAPKRMPVCEIESFLARHRRWIESHLAKDADRNKEIERIPAFSPAEIGALKRKAREVISERVAYYAPLVGVTYGKIAVRAQRTLWGSCSAKGNLSFNCLLMLAPPEVLDSIVVHELCHRKQMNHSRRFYDEVLRIFPNYFACKKWLKEKGALLLARLK